MMARIANAVSMFGVELDSLADVVSFGVAPAFLLYEFGLDRLGLFGVIIASLPALCGAVRLARFNVEFEGEKKDYFSGLPIPVQATFVVAFILVFNDGRWFEGFEWGRASDPHPDGRRALRADGVHGPVRRAPDADAALPPVAPEKGAGSPHRDRAGGGAPRSGHFHHADGVPRVRDRPGAPLGLPDRLRGRRGGRSARRHAPCPYRSLTFRSAMFKAPVRITLRPSILDPQGKAIHHALHSLGYAAVEDVRAGKLIELRIDTEDRAEAERIAREASQKLLANEVMEDFRVEVEPAATVAA